MSLRAEVDSDTCMSSGRCVADAPSAFRFDADEIAESVDGARVLHPDALRSIAENCPAAAIRLYEGDGPGRG